MGIKVLSLFDGISCARVALERCGYSIDKYYASEIDKYAIQVALKNYPDTIQLGDVCKITKEMVGDIDLLIGGSPCQDLSIAGKRAGLSGSRSGLFYEYVRILKEVKPKYFVLENVNSMPKEAKQVITDIVGVEPIMINAALVSAQNRKRLFWTNIPNVVLPEDRGILLKDILEENVDEKYFLTESNIKTINRNFGSKGKVIDMNKDSSVIEKMTYPSRINQLDGIKCPTLTSSMGTGGGNVPVIVKNAGRDIVRETDKACTLRARDYKGFDNYGSNAVAVASRGRHLIDGQRKDVLGSKTEQRIEVGEEKANTITSVQKDSMVMENTAIRKLTPIECERLQSLPDNYTEGISNSQRYKCLGNAFNVEVVRHILSFIK